MPAHEFKNSGFTTLVMPEAETSEAQTAGFTGEVIGIRNIKDAIGILP